LGTDNAWLNASATGEFGDLCAVELALAAWCPQPLSSFVSALSIIHPEAFDLTLSFRGK
jgi:hypothetical protein